MVPSITTQDIIETISTLYPTPEHLKENNIIINETVMTSPLASSAEVKSLLQKDNSPLLEIYKELSRGDVLKVLEEEEINMYMINAKSPCIIRNDEDTYVYFILPVNFIKE